MNPDLLSNTISLALLAVVAALLLAHLSQLAGRHRLRHAVDALTCAGLLYLFGMRAFGWTSAPREALCAVFALLAVAVVAFGLMCDARGREAGFPWRLTAAQAAAMAYLFGPISFWRPAASLILVFFFLLETMRWLAGTEEEEDEESQKGSRPPLFPPKRSRGLREFALAGTAALLAYVFAIGVGRAPLTPPPESPEPVAESPAPAAEDGAEQPSTASGEPTQGAAAETAQAGEPPATEAAPPAAPENPPPSAPEEKAPAPRVYTTAPGDTFKTIAKKLFGKPEKWRALAAANPTLKPGAKFKAGVTIKLP